MTRRRSSSRRPRNSQGALISKVALAFAIILLVGFAVYDCRGMQEDVPAEYHADGFGDLWYVKTPDGLPQEMVDYEGFRVSFNPREHVPNYVVWELTADEARANEHDRKNAAFLQDFDVDGCASPADYKRSGFDRGHMCPAADMKWSKKAMDDCHFMTNIVPQTHSLNSGSWATVENNCRNWAKRDSALIIICGPVLTDRISQRIGSNGVAVPERCFKVVFAPYANPPRGIGFLMSNFEEVGGAQNAAVTIDEVEAITGFDFFSSLPDSIENIVESDNRYQRWQRLKTR